MYHRLGLQNDPRFANDSDLVVYLRKLHDVAPASHTLLSTLVLFPGGLFGEDLEYILCDPKERTCPFDQPAGQPCRWAELLRPLLYALRIDPPASLALDGDPYGIATDDVAGNEPERDDGSCALGCRTHHLLNRYSLRGPVRQLLLEKSDVSEKHA